MKKIIEDYQFITGQPLLKLSLLFEHFQFDDLLKALPPSVVIETGNFLPESNDSLPLGGGDDDDARVRPMSRLTPGRNHHLIVVDDLIVAQKANAFLQKLFMVQSHHMQISVIVLVQVYWFLFS